MLERAEAEPQITPKERATDRGLPRWARVPASILAFISAGALDQITSPSPTVEAADPECRVGVRIESYLFFDMAQVIPEMGRRHILDRGIDPTAGSTAGFTVDAVPASYKAGDREKPGFKPLASTTIVRDQENNVGRGELRFTVPCNTTTVTSEGKTVPAVKIKLTSNLEDNDQYEQVIGDGRRVPVYFGSEIKKMEDFLRIADERPQIIKDLTPETKEKLRQIIKEAVQKHEEEKKKVEEKKETQAQPGQEAKPEQEKREGNKVEGKQQINGGIRFPDLSKISLEGIHETPVLGGIARGVEFVLDLPAKVVDKFTDPDTQAPLRWGINGLGWLLVWGPGFLGIPKTFSWNTVRFPDRYIRNRMNLAGGGPGVPHPWPL